MLRGNLSFAGNLDIQIALPADGRQICKLKDDLYKSESWKAADGNTYLWKGMRTYVQETGEWYELISNPNDKVVIGKDEEENDIKVFSYQLPSNWKKINNIAIDDNSSSNETTYSSTKINSLLGDINKFNIKVVETLPESGEQYTIYLIPQQAAATTEDPTEEPTEEPTEVRTDVYDEYIWLVETKNGVEVGKWEFIGTTKVDLSDYYTKTEVDNIIGTIELTPGPQGVTGLQGATGVQGIQGVTGPQGPQGEQGSILYNASTYSNYITNGYESSMRVNDLILDNGECVYSRRGNVYRIIDINNDTTGEFESNEIFVQTQFNDIDESKKFIIVSKVPNEPTDGGYTYWAMSNSQSTNNDCAAIQLSNDDIHEKEGVIYLDKVLSNSVDLNNLYFKLQRNPSYNDTTYTDKARIIALNSNYNENDINLSDCLYFGTAIDNTTRLNSVINNRNAVFEIDENTGYNKPYLLGSKFSTSDPLVLEGLQKYLGIYDEDNAPLNVKSWKCYANINRNLNKQEVLFLVEDNVSIYNPTNPKVVIDEEPVTNLLGYKGEPGKDGDAPYVGSNGNWFVAGADTGVKAQGPQGEQGIQGVTGLQGIQGATGVQGIQGATGVQGIQGVTGIQGETGPQGVTGLQGVTGEQGAQGVTGEQGVTGLQGITGLQGETGPQGATGLQGIQGVTGLQGITGEQGAQGVTGEQGVTGLQGITGLQGVTGEQGAQGVTGVQGQTGLQGTTGLQGIQGTTGLQGNRNYSLSSREVLYGNVGSNLSHSLQRLKENGLDNSVTELYVGDTILQLMSGILWRVTSIGDSYYGFNAEIRLTGPTGPTGKDGTSVNIQGEKPTVEDLPSTGTTNDGWLVGEDLYVWNGTGWSLAGKIKGPQGATGLQGAQGVTGVQGATGLQGAQGVTGLQGPTGPTGVTGSNGKDGTSVNIKGEKPTVEDLPSTGATNDGWLVQGVLYVWNGTGWSHAGEIKGPQGATGVQGETGPQGATGLQGPVVPATTSTLGGIKVGSNLSITEEGVLTTKGYTWDDSTNTMGVTGKIEASDGFFETSDARKKDIQGELSLDKAYDFIRNCEPILYNLKGNDKTQIGLIAQEVREFFPEIVNEDSEGYLSLDYAKLTVIILRVLKDLIDKK